jgi:Fe-S cluster assembly protein SufD
MRRDDVDGYAVPFLARHSRASGNPGAADDVASQGRFRGDEGHAMSSGVDFPVKPETLPYLDAFADDADEPQWLRDIRRRGLDIFARQGFPSRRGEGWRYLDLRMLAERPMRRAARGSPADLSPELNFGEAWTDVRLVNGICEGIISRPLPDGVWIAPTRRAVIERPDLIRSMTIPSPATEHQLASLNAALFTDGFVVDIAQGAALDRAIQIIHFGSKPGSMHTRSLVRLGAGCRATIVESFAGTGEYWRNDALTVVLGEGAALERVALVEESDAAIHLGDVTATLGAGARFGNFALLLGGGTVRHELRVDVVGEGASCRLDGAFVITGREEANIVTTVDHRASHGETRELVKGVAAGRAHGAFQGKISVHEGAQKVDAHQLSRNLIIGRHAVIDTKPELEIYADDVKCAHGASVGDLDEALLFYLRARGIAPDEARRLLVAGFIREAVERVEHAGLREHLLGRLAARLGKLESQP